MPETTETTRRLRHLFNPQKDAGVFGRRCLTCGEREHTLGHLSWVESLKYEWRNRERFNTKTGSWA